ncbi:LOW QUALITY PROTEIN: G2/mitotic-specific cyclin-B1 [Myiozetetes cayanensis]|uniref:LOW QUALITY PROTEIN: G2/mitotic-specific cyclin-B1 n=1 Tax=Myiozetetes cayanensis TaxID=478635 RepID=UPI00215EA2B0|nr:LOW QUALITY PROTEIN: G2/mitotic-specific cyclin-B1 [Myiozetetes cayanensis]
MASRATRENKPVKCKYLAGKEIDGNVHAVVIDWLAKVREKFKLQEETLFMTVAITDHFLPDNPVPETKLQLISITALFFASKYKERRSPHIADFSYVTNYSYLKFQICQMEMMILKALYFFLGFPLRPHFLRTSKIAEVGSKQYVLAKYLMELCIVDYDMDHLPPSGIAAAVFCLPLKLLDGHELLPSLQHCMFYTGSDLLPIMQYMAKNVVLVNKGAATRRLDSESSKELCQVDDLFSLVAELRKEGERLGSTGDSEEEVSW